MGHNEANSPAPNYGNVANPNENESKLLKKFKDSPLTVLGVGGWFGIVGYALYNIKHRNKEQGLAMYLIKTRIAAQTVVIGGMTLGVAYSLFANQIAPRLWPDTNGKK